MFLDLLDINSGYFQVVISNHVTALDNVAVETILPSIMVSIFCFCFFVFCFLFLLLLFFFTLQLYYLLVCYLLTLKYLKLVYNKQKDY